MLQYHNENSAKNMLNLLHIIIFATGVGPTDMYKVVGLGASHIDWNFLIVQLQHPQQCGQHPHQGMASYVPGWILDIYHTSTRGVALVRI